MNKSIKQIKNKLSNAFIISDTVVQALTGKKERVLKEIERWKKDLKRMSKIYRGINWQQDYTEDPDIAKANKKEYAKFIEAKKLFNVFSKSFNNRVYKHILPKKDTEDESLSHTKARKDAWTAYISLVDLFPDEYSRKSDKHLPAPWQLTKKEKDRKINKYNKAFKKAFDSLIEFTEEITEDKYPQTEQFQISNIPIILHNWGRDKDHEESIEIFINRMKVAINKIKKAGFGKVLKGLSVIADFETGRDASGTYDNADDTLKIKLAMLGGYEPYTLIHELGHRFYYRILSKKAREYWDKIIQGKRTTIEDEDILDFINTFIKPEFDKLKEFKFSKRKKYLKKKVKKADITKEKEAKYLEMIARLPIRGKILEGLKSRVGGEIIHFEFITDYARKNPEEAFAEAFAEYIDEGPGKLGEWTRDFFKRIVRHGNVDIRSSQQLLFNSKFKKDSKNFKNLY